MIGRSDEIVHVRCVGRRKGNAPETDRDGRDPRHGGSLSHDGSHSLSDTDDVLVSRARQDGEELLAAEAEEHIPFPERAPRPLRDGDEHTVADEVPVHVVDLLEVIEVEEEEPERLPRANGAVELLREALHPVTAVVEIRERVSGSDPPQALMTERVMERDREVRSQTLQEALHLVLDHVRRGDEEHPDPDPAKLQGHREHRAGSEGDDACIENDVLWKVETNDTAVSLGESNRVARCHGSRIPEPIGGSHDELAIPLEAERDTLEIEPRAELSEDAHAQRIEIEMGRENRSHRSMDVVHAMARRERLDERVEGLRHGSELVVGVDGHPARLGIAVARIATLDDSTKRLLDLRHVSREEGEPTADDRPGEPVVERSDEEPSAERRGEERAGENAVGWQTEEQDEGGKDEPRAETETDHPDREVAKDLSCEARKSDV